MFLSATGVCIFHLKWSSVHSSGQLLPSVSWSSVWAERLPRCPVSGPHSCRRLTDVCLGTEHGTQRHHFCQCPHQSYAAHVTYTRNNLSDCCLGSWEGTSKPLKLPQWKECPWCSWWTPRTTPEFMTITWFLVSIQRRGHYVRELTLISRLRLKPQITDQTSQPLRRD